MLEIGIRNLSFDMYYLHSYERLAKQILRSARKYYVNFPMTKIRPWPLYPKILFHQSIEHLLKRRHTKFWEHSQDSFFMNF